MTIYRETGITIAVRANLFDLYDVREQVLTDEISSYSHQVDLFGGYRSATISLEGSQVAVEDWLENGLARHIQVYNAAGEVIWEGFINKVSLSLGGLQVTRGPVLGIANRVAVTFTRMDYSVTPPLAGGETVTAIANDTDSQALYGTLEARLSGGQVTDGDAYAIRNSYLAERKHPETTQSLALGRGSAPAVTLECAGYVEYLDKFLYRATSTATSNVTAKIQAVLAAQPDGLISTDYANMDANALTTPTRDEKAETGLAVIKGLVALGDSAYNRYTFGIYAGRRAHYRALTTTIATTYDYKMRLADEEIQYAAGDALVYPWDVLPGRWIFYSDFLPGRGSSAALRGDPRVQLIESLTYSAPWGLSLSGGKVDTLSAKLAQLGIAGI